MRGWAVPHPQAAKPPQAVLVLGSWVGVRRRPFHLSFFLPAPRMVFPQYPSTNAGRPGSPAPQGARLSCRRADDAPPVDVRWIGLSPAGSGPEEGVAGACAARHAAAVTLSPSRVRVTSWHAYCITYGREGEVRARSSEGRGLCTGPVYRFFYSASPYSLSRISLATVQGWRY